MSDVTGAGVNVITFTSPKEQNKAPEGGDILFKLGDWEIHAMISFTEIGEAFHYCNRPDKHGNNMAWSYQMPNDDHCPGCDAIQPDEIQGLVAMYNYDKQARQGKNAFALEMMKKWYEEAIYQINKVEL